MEAPLKTQQINIPGTSLHSKVMLPARMLVVLALWAVIGPVVIVAAVLRALYLRVVVGRPSKILRHGSYNDAHMKDVHYPCIHTYKRPLDEARLRKALYELCSEDGIDQKDIDLKFQSEEPNDWPSPGSAAGSWDINHYIPSFQHGFNQFDYHYDCKKRGEASVVIRMHVWNGHSGKPTVAYFYGSGNRWDGSANYNFVKELMSRYDGNQPRKVFQRPQISADSADKFDRSSFIYFILKMPFQVGWNVLTFLWVVARAAKWAGGNGFGPKITGMNFGKEDSQRLYTGAKALGITPFAAFTYAAVKACAEVLGQRPLSIAQQASLQTRHYPTPGQTTRDLVGDWLVGPIQVVPKVYGLQEAMAGYSQLRDELNNIGPAMREAIMAKAYGLLNSGAATFQVLPTYNVQYHTFNRCLFMNNYGIRTMPEGSPFNTWNWNAPFWFGLNTINVDGQTTTLLGSSLFGLEVVEAMRDNIEATLRHVMAAAPAQLESIPSYENAAECGVWGATAAQLQSASSAAAPQERKGLTVELPDCSGIV